LDGTKITSTAQTHHGAEYTGYADVTIGTYELEAGEHTLEIEYLMPWGHGTGYNFKGIIVRTNATIATVSAEGVLHTCAHVCSVCNACADPDCDNPYCELKCTHVCESVCDTCEKCQNSSCTHYACTEKCECLTSYVFNAVDEKATISDGLSKNVDDNYVDMIDLSTLQTVTFTIYSENAQTVKLGFCISENPKASWTLVDYFRVWVNVDASLCNETDGASLRLSKDVYTAETIQGDGANYDSIMLGDVELQAGENTITIAWTCVGDATNKITLRSLLIDAEEEVTWAS
jgi:hypothetical protein